MSGVPVYEIKISCLQRRMQSICFMNKGVELKAFRERGLE
jgi:hypothetical protein